MANFRYELKPTSTKNKDDLATGDYDEFNSICGNTMVGVVKHKGNKEFSCMHGKKTTPDIQSIMVDDR